MLGQHQESRYRFASQLRLYIRLVLVLDTPHVGFRVLGFWALGFEQGLIQRFLKLGGFGLPGCADVGRADGIDHEGGGFRILRDVQFEPCPRILEP